MNHMQLVQCEGYSTSPSNSILFLSPPPPTLSFFLFFSFPTPLSLLPDWAWWWCMAFLPGIHSNGPGFQNSLPARCGWTDRSAWGCSSPRPCRSGSCTGPGRTRRSSGTGRSCCRLHRNTGGHFVSFRYLVSILFHSIHICLFYLINILYIILSRTLHYRKGFSDKNDVQNVLDCAFDQWDVSQTHVQGTCRGPVRTGPSSLYRGCCRWSPKPPPLLAGSSCLGITNQTQTSKREQRRRRRWWWWWGWW